jgi:hypothetical protein
VSRWPLQSSDQADTVGCDGKGRTGKVPVIRNIYLAVISGLSLVALDAAISDRAYAQYYPPPPPGYYPPPGYAAPPPGYPPAYGHPPCAAVTPGPLRGAGRGAAGGALIGAISGNAGRGAAIGATVGGVAGAARTATARAYTGCY